MTLPHTYKDSDGHEIHVCEGMITILPADSMPSASVDWPTSADAVALAKAVLEAAGDTGCVVIPQEEIDQLRAERDRARRARNRYQDERNNERQRAALLRMAYHAAKSAIPDAPERGTPLTADTDA